MKKCILLISLLVLITSNSDAQNVFKLNVANRMFDSYCFSYERGYFTKEGEKHRGIVITGNIMQDDGDVLKRGFVKDYVNSLYGLNFDNISMNGFSLSTGFRYYPKAKPILRGMYLEPYLKYANYGFSSNYVANHNAVDYNFLLNNGQISSYAGGLLLGTQFMLWNFITFDLWMMGLGAAYTNISFDASSIDIADLNELQLYVEEDMQPVTLGKLKSEISNNVLTTSSTGIKPDIRFGFSVGINISDLALLVVAIATVAASAR